MSSQSVQQKARSRRTRVGEVFSLDQVYLQPKRGILFFLCGKERYLVDANVVQKTPRSLHYCTVQICIILISCSVNKVEIPCNQPISGEKKEQLLIILWRTKNTGEPPIAAFLFSEMHWNWIRIHTGSSLTNSALSWHSDSTTSAITRQGNMLIIVETKNRNEEAPCHVLETDNIHVGREHHIMDRVAPINVIEAARFPN